MSNVRTAPRDYDVIAVGSGHHGLIAAAYLAKAGKRVLVLERHDYLIKPVRPSELLGVVNWHFATKRT